MDNTEARQVLQQRMEKYKSLTYDELSGMVGHDEHFWVTASSGKKYQLQVQVLWDGRDKETVRVVGSVDDAGIRAFVPLNDSFLVSREDMTHRN
jgi:hypothetical protein